MWLDVQIAKTISTKAIVQITAMNFITIPEVIRDSIP